jgi:DNA (cytosine-5)-methyltransferase 1
MSPTFGSLFSGIGGLDLGLERAGWACRWQVEIDPFCRRVLTKHWPDVPKYDDICALDGAELEPVDLLAGGFPCQDVSSAGSRIGIDGPRSGLWREYARLLGELRPRLALVENVPGLFVRGMGTVLGDLAAVGYDAEWSVVPACTVGAPHTRERVFVVAHPHSQRCTDCNATAKPSRATERDRRANPRRSYWSCEPRPMGVADGVPHRVDRLRGLGNAVVPQVAEWLGHRLLTAYYASALPHERTPPCTRGALFYGRPAAASPQRATARWADRPDRGAWRKRSAQRCSAGRWAP